MLEMKGIDKRFGAVTALNNASLSVGKGEIAALIGSNGSGKSTILKIITGVLNPTAGDVEINGRISALLELGAGFKIAMRDLEIRGAGNLLGPQQHGYIAGIGFAAYCDLLEQTIKRLQNGQMPDEREPDPILEIPLNAYIPDTYIANPRYKLELYRRFVDLRRGEEEDLMDEIIDRFGTPPEEVELLWRLAKVRVLCRKLKVRRINVRAGTIRIAFAPQPEVNGAALVEMVEKNSRYMKLLPGSETTLLFRTGSLEIEPLEWLEKNLAKLIQ